MTLYLLFSQTQKLQMPSKFAVPAAPARQASDTMEFFSLTGDEGSYLPPWYVRLLVLIDKMLSDEKWQVLNQF